MPEFKLLKTSRAALAALVMLILVACSSGDGPAAPQNGSLAIAISGLPTGAAASVTVTGPNGFSRALSSGTTLTGLAAGTYVISVNEVWHNGSGYVGAPPSQSLVVEADAAVTASGVVYALSTGALSISLGGLPAGVSPDATLTGPDGYHRQITEPLHLVGLKPGTYQLQAHEISTSNASFAAVQGTQVVQVAAAPTPASAHIAWQRTTGSMSITVSGLPEGKTAALSISGPGNYSTTVTSSAAVLEKLVPGAYTISAPNVEGGFAPSPTSQQVSVVASAQPTAVSVSYASAATQLSVQVVGLPQGANASITVAGPGGYSAQVSSSKVLSAIPAGAYTITAAQVDLSCNVAAPQSPTQVVNVLPGQTSSATVTYSSSGAGLNLCLDGAYITQAVQTMAGDVPLIAGRDGLLRVFVRASASNTAKPSVRARFYNGATLVHTITMNSVSAAVPTTTDESSLALTWNATVPGTVLQPGLRMLVDVDPTNAVAESNESDNVMPASGTAASLDIRSAAPLGIRLVPVIQAARGDTGRVSESNKDAFVAPMLKMFPIPSIDADIRQPYLFTGSELQSGGGNWTQLLSELNAVRIAEGSPRIYYGVIRVGYTSGVAGLGYIGLPTAIGWDHQPSGTEVMAHEVGHNFGRLHAPCGGPSGVDNQFPYSGATIGAFGYDILTGTLKTPSTRDLMSYCDPSWISDYTYKAVLNYRQSFPMKAGSLMAAGRERGLLVWGRIEQGRVVLEPGFEVDAPASMPARGPHQLTGVGAAGETLFSINFAGDRIADSPNGNDETFAFVIPLSQLNGRSLDRLQLSARGRQVELRSSGSDAAPTVTRLANGRVRVALNGAQAALIRDTRTGEILSVARGTSVDLRSFSSELEITTSDGVRSRKSKVNPR